MNKPKILVLDIETAPGLAYVWNARDEYLPAERLIRPGRMLCWSAKYVGGKYVFGLDERDGRETMLEMLRTELVAADAVVTYNGDKFDLPKINGQLLQAGLKPIPSVTSIDLYKTVKKMGLMYNRLEYVSELLKIGSKIKHEGFALWRKIEEGDAAAWGRMVRYNQQDVRLTERLYKKLRPFIANHPYLGPGSGGITGCPCCGSTKVQHRGTRRTRASIIERLQCIACGHWFPGKRRKAP